MTEDQLIELKVQVGMLTKENERLETEAEEKDKKIGWLRRELESAEDHAAMVKKVYTQSSSRPPFGGGRGRGRRR